MMCDSVLRDRWGPHLQPGKFFVVRKLTVYLTSFTNAFKVKKRAAPPVILERCV